MYSTQSKPNKTNKLICINNSLYLFESNVIVQTYAIRKRKTTDIDKKIHMENVFEIIVVLSYIIEKLEIRKLVKFQGSHN